MSLATLTNQPVTFYPAAGLDGHGKTTFGSPVFLSCRATQVGSTMLMPNGDKLTIEARVVINGDPGIKINDKLVLDQSYRVIRVRPAVNGSGAIHHTTYEVARWN